MHRTDASAPRALPARAVALSLLLLGASACQHAKDFLPRTHTTSVSPDGRHTASVAQGFNIDPPDDTLFLKTQGKPERMLLHLTPDVDWSQSIIWTPDSRKVGFVVSDDRLAVFDVESGAFEAFFFLAGTGCCGGPQESRHVEFSADGTRVSFDRYVRPTTILRRPDGEILRASLTREGEGTHARRIHTPARNLGRETLAVPTVRPRIRLTATRGTPLPERLHAEFIRNNRGLGVDAVRGADGLYVFPAVGNGTFERVGVMFPVRPGMRTFLRDIDVAETIAVDDSATPVPLQTSDGFTPIFDGSLTGWTVQHTQAGNFRTTDGVLRVEGPNGWLRSERQYQDFTLRLEFRFVTPDADSGIFLRTKGDAQFIRGWPNNSYQVQVRNPATASRFPPIGGLIRHGMPNGETMFDEAAMARVVKPTGEWQTLEIDLSGDRLTARLNNTEILRAGAIAAVPGYIGIQGEAGALEYRAITIRETR